MKKETLFALAVGFSLSVVTSSSNWQINRQVVAALETANLAQIQAAEMASTVEQRLRKLPRPSSNDATTRDITHAGNSAGVRSLSSAEMAILFDMLHDMQEQNRIAMVNINSVNDTLRIVFSCRALFVILVIGSMFSIFLLKINQHRERARELQESEQNMRNQKDKLESIMRQRERFMATLAHDMKVPLVGADRVFGLMIEQKVSTSTIQQADLLKKLRKNNAEVLSKLQDMIEIYRYENPHLSRPLAPANMADLLRRCVDRIAPFATLQGVSIEADLESGDRNCTIDSLGIERLVLSLLDNAVKFSNRDSVVSLAAISTPDELQIRIADTGVGISSEDQARLFNGIWSSDTGGGRSAGNGLGLYLAKLVAEAHGGSIDCVSAPGAGSTFTVHLPL